MRDVGHADDDFADLGDDAIAQLAQPRRQLAQRLGIGRAVHPRIAGHAHLKRE